MTMLTTHLGTIIKFDVEQVDKDKIRIWLNSQGDILDLLPLR